MTDTLIIDGSPRPKAPAGNKKAARAGRKSTFNMKLLISTAALAATLDGWALLAAHDQGLAAAPAPNTGAPAAVAAGGAAASGYLLDRPPIPTVVPVPGAIPRSAPPSQPAARALPAAPPPAQVPRPALRKVSPPPVAVTRSSR